MPETRIAIAGLGAIGRAVARKLTDGIPGLTLACVAAGNEEKARAWLKAQNIDVDPGSRPSVFPRFEPHAAGLWKPVVVAVNGVCASGGMNLLTHAAIILASERATFVDTHVNVGQVSGIEATCLARRIPLGALLDLVAQFLDTLEAEYDLFFAYKDGGSAFGLPAALLR